MATKFGQYEPLDLSAIDPEPTVTLTETFNEPEQQRRFSYINGLNGKQLKNLIHNSEHDADRVQAHWDRFAGGPERGWSRRSNIKRDDHPWNGGDSLEFVRTYSGPADGRPGRLTCAESL